jgi:subtilisin family serine protease
MFQTYKFLLVLLLFIWVFCGSFDPIIQPAIAFASQSDHTISSLNGITGGEERVWVMFSDKGLADGYNVKDLPDKTRLRREKTQGSAFDELDLPVFQPYVDGVIQLGAALCVSSRWLNGVTVIANDEVLKNISKLPYVKSIEPVVTYKISYPKQQQLPAPITVTPFTAPPETSSSPEKYYGMSAIQITQIHIDALHDSGYHGEGVTIALLDTGFNLSHVALRNVQVLAKHDFINNDDDVSDEPPVDDIGQDDHGTEVLAIIAGNDPGMFVGVAYAASYLLAKTEKVSDNGITFEKQIEEDWWVAGIEWAELNGADIVSSSLGYTDWYTYSDMNGRTAKTTIAANIAVEKGITVVVSAGNEGKSNEWPYISAPSDGFDVVAVGAVNENGEIADFSSIGPTYDGRIKPDLVAMGEGTYTVDPGNVNGYRKANGTSMATPLVAGTIALLKQALPEISKPKTLIKLLKYTASRSLNPDNKYGWGLVNAETAYNYAKFPGSIKDLNNWDPTGPASDTHELYIYPNPIRPNISKPILNIHSSKSMRNVRIYSISGSLIYQRQELDDAKFLTWNLKNDYNQKVASGVYICIIEYSDGTVEKRGVAVIE